MNNPRRRIRTLRASEVHAGGGIRIIAIESVCFDMHRFAPVYRMFARVEPAAIVVCSAGDHRVVDLASMGTSLEELKRDVPGLGALIEAAGN